MRDAAGTARGAELWNRKDWKPDSKPYDTDFKQHGTELYQREWPIGLLESGTETRELYRISGKRYGKIQP